MDQHVPFPAELACWPWILLYKGTNLTKGAPSSCLLTSQGSPPNTLQVSISAYIFRDGRHIQAIIRQTNLSFETEREVHQVGAGERAQQFRTLAALA